MQGEIIGILVRIALNLQVACFAINKFSCFMCMEAFPSHHFFSFCLEYFNTFTIWVFYIPCQVCSRGFFKLVLVNLFPFLSASYLLAFMQTSDFYVMVFHLVTLFKVFIGSNYILQNLVYHMYRIVSPANQQLDFFLSYLKPFTSFLLSSFSC